MLHFCKGCKKEKPKEEMVKNQYRPGGISRLCLECRRGQYYKYKNTDVGIKNARNAHLVKTYGITLNQFNLLLDEQNGNCAICGLNPKDIPSATIKYTRRNKLYVDHDHTTNAVRGLVCHNCNIMIGGSRDLEANLIKAIKYLRKFRNKSR